MLAVNSLRLSGRVTLVSEEQSENTFDPIDSTVLGNTMDVREESPLNAIAFTVTRVLFDANVMVLIPVQS